MLTDTIVADANVVIGAMVDRIAREFHPVRIMLFGSRARGTARPDSHVDLLVVLPEVSDKRRVTVEILRRLNGFGLPKGVVVTTPEEIARRGHLVGTVLLPALEEGRVLYER